MSAVDIKTCALLIFLLLELGGESDPKLPFPVISSEDRPTHLLKLSNSPSAKAKSIAMFVCWNPAIFNLLSLNIPPENSNSEALPLIGS